MFGSALVVGGLVVAVLAVAVPFVGAVTPPTVMMTGPASGTEYTTDSLVTVSAFAQSDADKIEYVYFYKDGVLYTSVWYVNTIQSQYASPYIYWPISSVDNGIHEWTANAMDSLGNVGPMSAPVTVTVNIPTPTPTPALDTIKPVVVSFDIQPRTSKQDFRSVSLTATDSGGSHLKSFEIYRAIYNSSTCSDTVKSGCSWALVYTAMAPANTDNWSATYSISQPRGTYWYGMHAIDNAGNFGVEPALIKVKR